MSTIKLVTPKVSIVIPVYNGANFLRESIDSALGQTYPNTEVIVVNDGSRDGGETEAIALSYKDSIRYFSKPNGGVGSALNLAIENMAGDYFSWLSHDDLYTPDKVQLEVSALAAGGNAIAYSDYSIFTDNPLVDVPRKLGQVPRENFRYWLTVESGLHGCSLLIPRRAFDVIGRFDEALKTTQDMDLWFKMAREYAFIHVPKVLVKSRCHDAQGSRVMSTIARTECNALFSRFISELGPDEIARATGKSQAAAYMKIAARMYALGFNDAASLAARFARLNEKSYAARLSMAFYYLTARSIAVARRAIPAAILVKVKMLVFALRSKNSV